LQRCPAAGCGNLEPRAATLEAFHFGERKSGCAKIAAGGADCGHDRQ
jgi:hypothetical protein